MALAVPRRLAGGAKFEPYAAGRRIVIPWGCRGVLGHGMQAPSRIRLGGGKRDNVGKFQMHGFPNLRSKRLALLDQRGYNRHRDYVAFAKAVSMAIGSVCRLRFSRKRKAVVIEFAFLVLYPS